MPFTFSHPIFAAPLKLTKPRYLSLTGLILGSMSPDFEYFIALEPYQRIGHTWQGLLLQALPLCFLFAFLFHYVVKRAASLHMPSWYDINSKLYRMAQNNNWSLRSPGQLLIFIVSVGIGFCSHLLVDACTHKLGFVVVRTELLQQIYGNIPAYKWLQHGLSLFGLAAEAIILFSFFKRQANKITKLDNLAVQAITARQKSLFWCFVIVIMLSVTGIKLLLTNSANMLGILVVAPISGFMLGLLTASIVYKFRS